MIATAYELLKAVVVMVVVVEVQRHPLWMMQTILSEKMMRDEGGHEIVYEFTGR